MKPNQAVKNIRKAKARANSAQVKMQNQGDDLKTEYGAIQAQIEQEFVLCWTYMLPKTTEWLRRLKLYNNQARDKSKVGYPLVYSVHQVIHANLIGDKLQQEFKGREEGDQDQADNLNALSEYDCTEMQKDENDDAWNWDAEIFGRG